MKNRYLLMIVVVLAALSTTLSFMLFFGERANAHRIRELNRRVEDLEGNRGSAPERRSDVGARPQAMIRARSEDAA